MKKPELNQTREDQVLSKMLSMRPEPHHVSKPKKKPTKKPPKK